MAAALFLGFIVIPGLEIYVIIRVGELIGFWPTALLIIAESLLGAWLVKREGRRAWRALRQALNTGRLPSRQLADAALVLVGGTLLLTPGFLTDIAGFAFVLPATRPIARRILAWMLMSRLFANTRIGRAVANARAVRPGRTARNGTGPVQHGYPAGRAAPGGAGSAGPAGPGGPNGSQPTDRVVPGEVVEDEGTSSAT